MGDAKEVAKIFRALVESADKKFVRVRDLPFYGEGGVPRHHYFHKVFKAYTKLWKFQQEHRSKLTESGLQRWEIGEIASRIGQLYYGQYMRTSETRFLLEAYVFYEAILNRGYFQGKGSSKGANNLSLRLKELRFYARFLLVSLLLNRMETVKLLADRFRALVEDCKANFRETSFKEWKLLVHEIARFLKADTDFVHNRPLRYCTMYDSHPASLPYVTRFHAKRVLKLHDALLTGYHRNEVRFTELSMDTFRMLQCLEWEPSGSFFQMRTTESSSNGAFSDQSGTSGLIDINLAMDMTDPTLPPNPRKAILYRPSVTHLIAVIATIVEELPSDSIFLIYLSASGRADKHVTHQVETAGVPRNSSNLEVTSQTCSVHATSRAEMPILERRDSNDCVTEHLWLGPRGSGGSNDLYPGDIIPFTRKPLFLIVDSDNSHAFKVVHGAERGETAALFLSPRKTVSQSLSTSDLTNNGSQFTYFLTAPLQAFCQLVGLSPTETDKDILDNASTILSNALSEWEVKLCKSTHVDLVWAQVLCDPFLRRLVLRFIFCRSVLSAFCTLEDAVECLPACLPQLPDFVSPHNEAVQSSVRRLANSLGKADIFHFHSSLKEIPL